ncbi:TetR family transcriptional regulator [Amycolatopsis pigmentata]|uniref:TetR family transcriptional regulator n=1 Tax=Amycolatopsis pigmentata TaxID=450801 RepID=A0ABW5G4B6_9PSEU
MTAEPVTRHARKERTRRALLDAALRLLADGGFTGLSLREVTKQAGIVPTAFYRHFTSMDELGVVLVEESMRTLRATIREARRDSRSSADIIGASVRTLHEHVRAHEAHFRFVIRERHGGAGPVRQAIAFELKLVTSELAVDLARFKYLRDWTTDDLRMVADLIVTAMLATVLELLEARAGDTETDERILRRAEKKLRLITLGMPQWRSGT